MAASPAVAVSTTDPAVSAADLESCHRALPLPLDHPIHGHAGARASVRYAVETTRPGLLLIEARATGAGTAAPRVRFLGRVCRPEPGNVAAAAIHGRHVHHVATGTYFVAVEPAAAGGGFVVDAWLVPAAPRPVVQNDDDPPREPLDEWDEVLDEDPFPVVRNDDDPPREPLDEWDEVLGEDPFPIAQNDDDPPREPLDEWDEILGEDPFPVARNDDDPPREPLDEWDEIRDGVCPWATRPGLLSTLTCAPRLRLAESDTTTLAPGSPRVLALRLAGDGRLLPESPALLLDRHGRPLAELAAGESVDLAAGRYFLRLGEPGAGDGPAPWTTVTTRFHFVLD